MHLLMFRLGALILAVGSMLLFIAVVAHLLLERPLSTSESVVACVAAFIVGSGWWLLAMRRNHASKE
jgi:hypothetical protein